MKNYLNKIVIAGPCSAESREQIDASASFLKRCGVDLMRAGVWKPRTKPNGFEGFGEKAIEWLKEAKQKYGIPIAVEIAIEKHLTIAVENGMDAVWIGARTVADPFAVQGIADAIKKTIESNDDFRRFPIIIKNPIIPQIELWVGAVERVKNAGAENIILVHRGFATYENNLYRNSQLWHIPIEMRRRYPDLKILCDPSHIGGKREFIHKISQQAMDLNFDGLMIEVHPNPDSALSDSLQQLSFDEFQRTIGELKMRESTGCKENTNRSIEVLREQIDEIDNSLFSLLSRRMKIARQIGEIKHENNLAVLQSQRYAEMVDKLVFSADRLELSKKFVKEIMELIHRESIDAQLDK